MKVTKNIDIYLTGKRPVKVIDVVQYDTGIQLVFTVKDCTIPSDATATLYVQKPSGKFVYQQNNITIANSAITVDLENQALTEYGRISYQMTISSGSDTVTSFAGLMIVERSLKDAGAVESKTVIKAFDEVTERKISEFQARARTISDAVIATIPDDYTELTVKVNESANAIKGKLSGAVVSADDVSPVEHLMNVKVKSKNLIPYPFSNTTKTENGITFTDNGDGTITANGTAEKNTDFVLINTGKNFTLSKGKYFVSGTVTNAELRVYANKGTITNIVVTDTGNGVLFDLNNIEYDYVCAYIRVLSGATFNNVVLKPQLEHGEEATDFAERIDPSTVMVRRCGKNLLNPIGASSTLKGVTFTNNGNGTFTIKGTSTGAVSFALTDLNESPMHLSKGQTYTQSVIVVSGTKDANVSVVPAVKDADGNITWNYFDDNRTKTTDDDYEFYAYTAYINSGATVDMTFKVQLEVGDVATDYEAYKECTEHIPTSDGVVEGVTSVSPNVTIMTDTEGMIVECEYNKDTNKVVQKFADALGITI